MSKIARSTPSPGRYNTATDTKMVVWIQAAGHCELCGTDLTHDHWVGRPMRWGEVAHILSASPQGPRARGARCHHGPAAHQRHG